MNTTARHPEERLDTLEDEGVLDSTTPAPKDAETAAPRRRWWLRALGYIGLAVLTLIIFLLADAWRAMGTSPSGERLDRMKASAHYDADEGVFVNLLQPQEPDIGEAFSRWLEGGENRVPKTTPPFQTRLRTDFEVSPASGLRVTWLGHSTTLIEIDDRRFLTDPVWAERASPLALIGPKRFHPPPLAFDALPDIDAVIISHDHYDHLDYQTIEALNARGDDVLFITPLGVGTHLEYWGVPADRIIELDWWESTRVGDVELVSTPSRHFSGRGVLDRNATQWASWAIKGPRHRVFFSGDTGMHPQFQEIGERHGPFDLTMLESGAYNQLWSDVHLGPEQAVLAHQMLRGDVMMPIHWGTFNLALHAWIEPAERVIAAAHKSGVTVVIPRPGESVEPARPTPVARWWPDLPFESADIAPVVSTGLASAE